MSDAHEGLKTVIGSVLYGASWQRNRVHFVHNARVLVPKLAAQSVTATVHTVFAQPELEMTCQIWHQEADVLAYPGLPSGALVADLEQ